MIINKKGGISKLVKSLNNTEGTVLRYIVTTPNQPVAPSRSINHINWSPLPNSFLQAKSVFTSLAEKGLIRKQGRRSYTFTDLGVRAVEYANHLNLWEVPVGKYQPDSRRNSK